MKLIINFIVILLISINITSAVDNLIENIEVEGLKRIETETVLSYSELKLDEIYTEDLGNEALKKLFETNLFSNIQISFDDGVVTIKVTENPTVNQIMFEGNKKFKDEDLLLELSVKERSIYSRTKVKKDIERMLTLYQRSGRFLTQINPTAELLENNRINLTYEIKESEVAKVSKIIIIGNNVFPSRKIKSIMKTKEEKLLKFWTSADNYDPDKLEYDKQLITEFYNNNGYPNFKFSSSIAQLVPNKNSFEVIIAIDEGEMYKFGKITAESKLERLNIENVLILIAVQEESIYEQRKIKNSINDIKDSASVLGYTFIDIYPEFIENKNSKTIDINFKINEGPRVYVKKIDISGNTRTIDKVIRRQIRLSEGDAYNKFVLDISKDKIRALNFFSTVDIGEESVSEPDKLNINLHVEEKNTGEVSLGAGYSSVSKANLQFGLKENNFLGKGQRAKLMGQFANTSTTYDISFEEPYFNNKDLALRTDLYSKFYDPSSANYETEELGLGLALGFPLAVDKRLRVNYSLFTSKVKADSDATAYELLLAGTDTVSSIGAIFTFDRRNSPYRPSRGSLLRIDSDLAGIGGTANYIKEKLELNIYKMLSKKFIGAIKLEGGHLNGFNNRYAPLASNFQLGGDNLRGFRYGKVGPKVGTSYTGGQYYYLTSLETNIDLPIEEFDITSTVFVDVGSVWGLDQRYGAIDDKHNMRASAGINFNWDSAIGPINIIYAKALKKENTDSVDTIYFDIGYNF